MLALAEERALFTGDHVMGWSTTVIARPDGDMAAYVDSLRLVIGRDDAVLWPTHGGPVTEPRPYLAAYLAHRVERERQVLASSGAASAGSPTSSPSSTSPSRRSCAPRPPAACSPTWSSWSTRVEVGVGGAPALDAVFSS